MAFLACLRAGIVAVPVYPPNPRGLAHHLRAFASIAATCGASVVLTHREFSSAKRLGAMATAGARALAAVIGGSAGSKSAWPDLPWWDVTAAIAAGGQAKADDAAPAGFQSPAPRLMADPAFLQFTSGSTSEPKGVVISHRSMTHNLRTIVHALRAGQDTRVVSWLPQYHDMGLIGSHCGLLFCGGTGTYFSPIAFVQNPALLLSVMEASGATHVQMPNFGYALTARKAISRPVTGQADGAAEPAGLSPVAHLFNAAEPVTSAACDAFVRIASKQGMRAAAMSPGYGLAESTVYVSDGGRLRLRLDRAKLSSDGVVKVVAWADGGPRCTRLSGSIAVCVSSKDGDEVSTPASGAAAAAATAPAAVRTGAAAGTGAPAAIESTPWRWSSVGSDTTGSLLAERAGPDGDWHWHVEGVFGTGGAALSAEEDQAGALAPTCPPWLLEVCGLGAPPGVQHGLPIAGVALGSHAGEASADGHDLQPWELAGGCIAIVGSEQTAVGCLGPEALLPSGLRDRLGDSGSVPMQAWPPRQGEVWLRGASSSDGYWGNPVATAGAFGKQITSIWAEGPGSADSGGGQVEATAAAAGSAAAAISGDGAANGGPAAGSETAGGETGEWPMHSSGRPFAPHTAPGADTTPGRPWLSTGDLGFVWGGELFLTGRLKDLVIVGGRNHYPSDLEATAESLGRSESRAVGILRPGCTAAFSVSASEADGAAARLGLRPDMGSKTGAASGHGATEAASPADAGDGADDEVLVLVGEPRPDPATSRLPKKEVLAAVAQQLAATLAGTHGVTPRLVLLFQQHTVRKTSSGKVARLWNARALRQLASGEEDGPWGTGAPVVAGVLLQGQPHSSAGAAETLAGDVAAADDDGAAARRRELVAGELVAALKSELAVYGGVTSPSAIPDSVAIGELGLSSLAVAQWTGSCRNQFGLVGISDEAVWAHGFTLAWIRDNADALRRGEPLEPPAEPEPPQSSAPSDGAGAAGASKAAPRTPLPGVHEASWCETNFPCCPCCF